jgi:site-specific DNA recombinase
MRQLFGSLAASAGMVPGGTSHLAFELRLSYLAPDIVRALLEGRQPIELTKTRLLRLSKDLPHDWSEQRHVLGFAA